MSKYKGLVIGSVLLVLISVLAVIPGAAVNGVKGSQICGAKFNDKNRNGIMDDDEEGLSGWIIKLSGFDTATGMGVSRSTTTDAGGIYCFSDLSPGIYWVYETTTGLWVPTTPPALGPFSVPPDPVIFDFVNFGNKLVLDP